MRDDNVSIVVGIVEIGPMLKFDRPGKASFVKRNVTLQTINDKLIFSEVRKMEILDGFNEGDLVEVKLSFAGSQKGEKKYNNIFINEMVKK